jgi:hypothetical protein
MTGLDQTVKSVTHVAMTHFKSLLFSSILVGVSACSSGADVPPETNNAPTFNTAAMDALLSSAVQRGDVIGFVIE